MNTDIALDNNFLEQAKWILAPNNVKYLTDCPVFTCKYCVVHYNNDRNGCSTKCRIEAAKKYIRSEKLKRII